ncbi:MAG: hypothetical protein V1743_01180 [Nanoarchaeota archaeon]
MVDFIRADLHFHPNFGSSTDSQKAVRILENCIRYDLNALLISEHVYKNPRESFTLIYATQQKLIQSNLPQYQKLKSLFVFPAAEYITMEGSEMLLFHDTVYGDPQAIKTIIYEIDEAFIRNPFKYTVIEIVDIAKKYGFAISAPHPFGSASGGIKFLGKTPEGRHRLSQIIQNRRIGIEILNAGFDDLVIVMKKLGIRNDLLENVSETPASLLKDAQAKFVTGGSDAHTPETMGSGIAIPFHGELTREKVYNAIINNNTATIFRAKKGFLGRMQSIQGSLKALKITLGEVATENNIKKSLVKAKQDILEAYTRAYEAALPIEDIIKIKALFPGQNMMLLLSSSQQQRIKNALEQKKQDAIENYVRAFEAGLPVEEIKKICMTIKILHPKQNLLMLLSVQQRERIQNALEQNSLTSAQRELMKMQYREDTKSSS